MFLTLSTLMPAEKKHVNSGISEWKGLIHECFHYYYLYRKHDCTCSLITIYNIKLNSNLESNIIQTSACSR